MRTHTTVRAGGTVEAEVIANPMGRRIAIDIIEGGDWSDARTSVFVWETDNPAVFHQLAKAFGLDVGEQMIGKTHGTQHIEQMPA